MKILIIVPLALLVVQSFYTKNWVSLGLSLAVAVITFYNNKNSVNQGAKTKLFNFAKGFQGILDHARNLYSASDSLKKIVLEENASVMKSSSALEEISTMLSRTSDGASQLASMAQEAKTSVKNGKSSVNDLYSGLKAINKSTDDLNSGLESNLYSLQSIINSLSEIKIKTNVINDIVFQTKLLSFNASVEAARAGDHGKGFSVVAEEMSKLAATSGDASKEINKILEHNLTSTQEFIEKMKVDLITLMKTSREDVAKGLKSAEESSRSFDEIDSKVEVVADLSGDISTASREQEIGVREITDAIHKLQDTSTQLNQVSQETLKAALSLSETTELQSKELISFSDDMNISIKLPDKKFDFTAAINAHLDWKMKLSSYLNNPDNSLEENTVCKDNACALGKWIYGDGQMHSHLPTHENLRLAHAHFHQTAGSIIGLINNNQKKQAEQKLAPGGPYMEASEKCVSLIRKLKSEVEG